MIGIDGFEVGKDEGFDLATAAVDAHCVEIEDLVELVAAMVDELGLLSEGDAGSLADRHVVVLRQDFAVHLLEVLVAMGTGGEDGEFIFELLGGEVGHAGLLGNDGDYVHAEAVDAFIEPEAHDGENFLADLGIIPVEVGLFYGEVVEVVLVGFGVELPGGAGEDGAVVVGRFQFAVGASFAGAPEVEVTVGVVFGAAGFDKPFVLVGGMVGDEVDDEAHVPLLDAGEHGVEVGHRAEVGHYGAVVADVVAVVGVGGGEVGREPDDVDAKLLKVIEVLGDAFEVADTIAVGVLEGARVDLVDDGFFPPFGLVAVDEVGSGVSLGRDPLAMAGAGRCDEGCREEGGKNGGLDHRTT